MYVFLRRAQLIDSGLTRREIERALTCCLIRIRRDRYTIRAVCDDPLHAPLSRLGKAADITVAAEIPGLLGDQEGLRRLIASRRDSIPDDAVFSHLSAVLLHMLDLVTVPSKDVELIRPLRSRRLPGLVTRKRPLAADHITDKGGYRVTGLVRTLADVSCDYPPWISVPVIDSALRSDPSHPDLRSDLLAIGSAHFARAQFARMQRAVGLSDPARESAAESLCATRFVEYCLSGFESQAEILDGEGTLAGRVDFVHRQAKIIVEVDGLLKYTLDGTDRDEAFQAERLREYRLRNLGYAVFRLTWADLFRADVFLQIRELLFQRADA